MNDSIDRSIASRVTLPASQVGSLIPTLNSDMGALMNKECGGRANESQTTTTQYVITLLLLLLYSSHLNLLQKPWTKRVLSIGRSVGLRSYLYSHSQSTESERPLLIQIWKNHSSNCTDHIYCNFSLILGLGRRTDGRTGGWQ